MPGAGHSVRVLCRPEVGAGFRLAGLRPIEVASTADVREKMEEMLALPEVGVVLIEEELYDRLPEPLRRQLGRRPLPMVVPFPEPAWAGRAELAEAYIVELLRQVIGYRVRLR
jgi:vacuolar-type H+-ATPase subunit F/Vma7